MYSDQKKIPTKNIDVMYFYYHQYVWYVIRDGTSNHIRRVELEKHVKKWVELEKDQLELKWAKSRLVCF